MHTGGESLLHTEVCLHSPLTSRDHITTRYPGNPPTAYAPEDEKFTAADTPFLAKKLRNSQKTFQKSLFAEISYLSFSSLLLANVSSNTHLIQYPFTTFFSGFSFQWSQKHLPPILPAKALQEISPEADRKHSTQERGRNIGYLNASSLF